jgi:hypothetical protein
MRLELSTDSRVFVDLRATGVLRAVGHDPTLVARPGALVLDVGDAPLDLGVEATFRVDAIEPPSEISAADREKMRGHLTGADVLDARRFPTVDVRGRYAGTIEAGRLEGELFIRGIARAVSFDVRAVRDGGVLTASGAWEGRLTHLGIKPFKALLGALRLDDWIRLRLDARFAVHEA